MKVKVVSSSLVKVDLEYQACGLSEKNVRELIRLLERSILEMREISRKEVESKNQLKALYPRSVV
jgi:hypothetical protein